MPPPQDHRSPQNGMSDDEVSVTSSVMSEMQDEYILDKILAERTTSNGRQWLVQWEGYPEERSTWEPKSSFTSEQPLEEWQAQKMRIARDYVKPYDVAAFEKRVSAIEKARAIRKAKRRAKRIRLGLPVSPDSDELDSSDEAEESDDDIPLDRPSRSQRGSLRKIDTSLNDFVIEDNQLARKESPKKAKINRSPKSQISGSETGDHLSDDSLVEDLRAKEFNKSHKRLKKNHKPRSELFISKSPEPPPRQLPQAGTASIQSPPTRQMPPVGAQRRQSQPSRQVPSTGTDRRQLQPSKKSAPAGLDRRQSMPTLSSSKYSGTMNQTTGNLKGAVGTGPKRYAEKQSKYQGKPKVQGAAIMGRWDASVKQRKLTAVVPGLVPSLNAKTFGKLSIQRKYEKAGRNEPAPNPKSLTFINPRKDKAGPQPIIMPKRNTSPIKTAWEIYQERLKNETSDLGDAENQNAVEPEVGEDVPMDIDSGGGLDVIHAALQSVSTTGSKEIVDTGRSGQSVHTTEHQMKDVPPETHTSETRADMLSEQTPNSATEIPCKCSVFVHSENPGDTSVHDRYENRHANDVSLSGSGLDLEVSVPTGPKSTQEPITSDADAKALLATIRVGHEGHRVGAVRLKGLERHYRTMLLRTKFEGQLEVWCKISCTAKDYKRYHNGADSKPFATGVIEPFYDSASSIHAMAATLNAHASGGLYLQDQFALLMYPANAVNWAFLDPDIQASPKLGLKFIMRSPLLQPFQHLPQDLLQDQMLTVPMSLPDEPKITTVFRHLFNIDYKTLVSQNAKKIKEPNTFFLVFPASCNDEHELVVRFLEANRAIIYSSHISGSWDYFTSHIDTGVILIHPAFDAYHLIPSLPATLKKNINVFSIGTSIEPSIDPTSSPPYKITYTPCFACERLFPHGGAILLTESVFLDDPKAARYILQWFKESLIKKPVGTWKLVCRPGIKEWMAELVDEVPEDRALYAELYSLLTTISPSTDPSSNHESETPLITPTALLETYTSHPTPTLKAAHLVEWFAGWANCHVHAFRRFHVVHPVVVERWGERWRTLDLLTPEDFMGMYRLSGHNGGSGGGEGGGDEGRRRKSVGS